MDDLGVLTSAAEQAGQIAMRHWRNGHQTWDKEDGAGPVTEADLEVDAFLKETLTAAFPECGWLSEETEDTPERQEKDRVIIVDPIDGTRSFAKGDRTWAHSIAVVENGVPVLGVVYLPVREKMYTATRERASLNGNPIQVSEAAGLDAADILSPRSAFKSERWQAAEPSAERHFRPSLAYRLALVAEGRFDAMVTPREAWEWDIAAGALLVTAAGGRISDLNGQPIVFNSANGRSDGVLAGGPQVHEQLAAGFGRR